MALPFGSTARAATRGPHAARTSPQVSLSLPSSSLHAGQDVEATLMNDSRAKVEVADCLVLARQVGERWVTITHTHGYDVSCPKLNPASATVKPDRSHSVDLELYDDLTPGSYRVSLPYRNSNGEKVAAPFSTSSRTVASVTFSVLDFDPGPPPQLTQSAILAIALKAATEDGDRTPTLVQHVEASALSANLLATSDLVLDWTWSYLIAERGTFSSPTIPTPAGVPTGPGPAQVSSDILTIVVNAKTGAVSGGGFATLYPELTELGTVTTDQNTLAP